MAECKKMMTHKNQREAVVWIENCQKAKYLKKCGFLRMANCIRHHMISKCFIIINEIVFAIKWLNDKFISLPTMTQTLVIFLGITALGFSHIDELIKLLNAIKNW